MKDINRVSIEYDMIGKSLERVLSEYCSNKDLIWWYGTQ